MSDHSSHKVSIEPPEHGIQPDFWRGALAGLMGGIAGAAAKLLVEQIIPPRAEREDALPEKAAVHSLEKTERQVARHSIHWSLGPLIGAAYGAAVEFEPELTVRHGAAFGLGLNGLSHKHLLPIFGLPAPVDKEPKQERLSDVASLLVYGVVTETVRRMIRGR